MSIISSETEFKAKSIDDTLVGDLLSHMVGALPLNQDVDRVAAGFPESSLFSQPKSLMLVAFPGLTKGIPDHTGLLHFANAPPPDDLSSLKLLQKQRFVTIDATTSPYDTVSEVTTILTGRAPRSHGIIQRMWRGADNALRTAYRSEDALPLQGNLASVWSRAHAGRAAVLAASSDAELAAALGAHPALLQAEPRWSHALLMWDGAELQNVPAGSSRPLAPVVAAAAAGFEPTGADAALFAELQLAAELPHAGAETAALLRDDTPDYVAMAFASLAGVKARYGATSPQWARALQLVAAAITDLRAALPSDAVVAVLVLPAATPVSALTPEQLQEFQATQLGSQLYVEHYVTVLCAQLPGALCVPLVGSALQQVEDRPVYADVKLRQDATNATTTAAGNTTRPPAVPDITSDDIAVMQIALWFTIFVAIAAIGGIYGIFAMDSGQDTLLYRPSQAAGRPHSR